MYNFGPRAWRERYTVFSSIVTGAIVAVVENDEKEPMKRSCPTVRRPSGAYSSGLATLFHDELIGTPMPDRHRNPFTYVDDPAGLLAT